MQSGYRQGHLRLSVHLSRLLGIGAIWALLLIIDEVIWRRNYGQEVSHPFFDFLKYPLFYVYWLGVFILISICSWPVFASSRHFHALKLLLMLSVFISGVCFYWISYDLKLGYWTGAMDYFHPNEAYNALGSLLIIYGFLNGMTLLFLWANIRR